MSDKTCEERIDSHYDDVMETLRILWAGYCNDECPECDGEGKKINPHACCEEAPDYEIECKLCNGTGKLEEDVPNYGSLFEYGLSFDYCYPENHRPGYFRYQLSWGGPSDEFRIYADRRSECNWVIWKIEYWFMDWFDGASKTLHGEDAEFMENLLTGFFVDCGTFDREYDDAMENWEPEDDEEDEINDEEENDEE